MEVASRVGGWYPRSEYSSPVTDRLSSKSRVQVRVRVWVQSHTEHSARWHFLEELGWRVGRPWEGILVTTRFSSLLWDPISSSTLSFGPWDETAAGGEGEGGVRDCVAGEL